MENELEQRIEVLERELNNLRSFTTIPFDIGVAIKARVLSDAGVAQLSNKGATTEDQAVNEAGASTYNVLKSPDGFLKAQLAGVVYYIPVYT